MDAPKPLEVAREAKHQGVRLVRHTRWRLEQAHRRYLRISAATRPYVYDAERYRLHIGDVVVPTAWTFPVSHIQFDPVAGQIASLPDAPNIIWCFWMGDNPLTPNRVKSLDSIRRMNPNSEVILVSMSNLDRILVEGYALHPNFEDLSAIHKSDYLRSYVMLHHGGAYCDIKKWTAPWAPIIRALNSEKGAWLAGPEETSPSNVSAPTGRLGREMRANYSNIPCQAAFAFRPGSPFAEEWSAEVGRRMDYFSGLLEKNPARDPFGCEGNYPVPWNALHGSIFSPLCMKYFDRVIVRPEMEIDFSGGYR